MELGFECPNSGTALEPMDNDRLVNAIEARIDDLSDELNVDTDT